MDSHSLLQGIFLTQGSNPEKPVCRLGSNSYNWTRNNGLVKNWERVHQDYILLPSLFNLYAESVSSVAQSCPTLCDLMDCSMPGFLVHHQLWELAQIRPLSWWCHPTISCSVVPFSSYLQSFPASGSFQMSQFFTSGGQSIGALGLTGLISLQSKGLSRIFSNTTVQKHQLFSAQLSLQSNSHIHTWPLENHSFN